MDGILHVLRTGCQWKKSLPKEHDSEEEQPSCAWAEGAPPVCRQPHGFGVPARRIRLQTETGS